MTLYFFNKQKDDRHLEECVQDIDITNKLLED